MDTRKKEVIEKLCLISTRVMTKAFKDTQPADCFCSDNMGRLGFQFSDDAFSRRIFTYLYLRANCRSAFSFR